jgi:hypothetical protein
MITPVPFDPQYVRFIRRILSVAETDKPEWNPASVYVYSDGKDGRKQCTLSIGFTADGGNLTKVLERYVKLKGAYGPQLTPYIEMLKNGSPGTSSEFIKLLDEKRWIKDYTDTRREWLSNHSNKILNGTIYRCNCFLHEIRRANWSLEQSPVVMNDTDVHHV